MDKSKTTQTNFGISILRILATLSVIMIHVSGPLVVEIGKISNSDWHAANFYDSISRYAVPVFFMISGSLLLGRQSEIKDFLKNRLGKIIPPFLFWSLFYSLTNRFVFTNEAFDITKIVKDVFYGSEYHLWFVYSLIGIYLITPIFQKWIAFSKKEDVSYFLIVWVFTLLLAIPGVNIYFPKINLSYFSGFLGYFILGYYLKNYVKSNKIISLSLILIGVFITIFGTYYFSFKNNKFFDHFYDYISINTLLVSVGVFLLFSKIENINEKAKPIIARLDACSFGIFLIHPFVLTIFAILGMSAFFINPILGILIISLACFSLSFIVIFIIKKIKFGHLIA
ncbi:acyltransferase [Flavobacterium terrigena]|uniref:Surface polysaccharide O-acyltransferase, integral membrane enzyme n=1 Tax=Flavobacterium terrigena TaxID=402734 RepID=A0A1H6RBC5_9FLAO|nr:acyltransferase family protein [Flavobacterium terrigena]SEI48492.1 Surface polysaccharide O-acyltransferase, integral membrane enzyme [Flavobacterium terrigena]